MRDLGLGILVVLVLVVAPGLCTAEEFSGKLVRVDLDTVTLRRPDDSTMVFRVDGGNRRDAAPYLGKTVVVHIRNDQGECHAIRFGASQ